MELSTIVLWFSLIVVADILPVSAGHRELSCESPGRLSMKLRKIIYTVVAAVGALALFVIFCLYVGSSVPAGQQALVHLHPSNFDSLKKSFNESADSVRVVVMLSPT